MSEFLRSKSSRSHWFGRRAKSRTSTGAYTIAFSLSPGFQPARPSTLWLTPAGRLYRITTTPAFGRNGFVPLQSVKYPSSPFLRHTDILEDGLKASGVAGSRLQRACASR